MTEPRLPIYPLDGSVRSIVVMRCLAFLSYVDGGDTACNIRELTILESTYLRILAVRYVKCKGPLCDLVRVGKKHLLGESTKAQCHC